MRNGRAVRAWAAVIGALGALALAPHPLHTTLAVFTIRGDGSIAISVRAFADDFGAAARLHAGERMTPTPLPSNAAIQSYVRAGLRVTSGTGSPVALAWCGTRHEGELVWLCFTIPAAAARGQLRLRNALLVERFADQVNIVQIVRDTRRTTMLFTKKDGARALSD